MFQVVVGLCKTVFRYDISLSASLIVLSGREVMQPTVKAMKASSTFTGSFSFIDSSSLWHNVSSLLLTTGSMRVIDCREKYGFKAALRIR
jgi:hypothetical protein